MTRTIRTLAAKLFLGGVCLAPLAVPATAVAQNTPANAVPDAKKLSAKEQHAKLLKCSGWIQQRNGDGQVLSHGTGWVLDADRKLMVTNDHVVEGADAVWVVFPKYKAGKLVREESEYAGEKGVKAVVIDRDRTRDLAVIQLDSLPDGLAALPLAADEPEEGDAVRTIGGYTNGSDNLVFGGVGGEVRTVGTNGGLHGKGKVRVVLSTVSINGGNSGGPLVNEAGELVAVNSYSVNTGPTGRAVSNVNGHISVKELKAYLAEVDPLVAPKGAKEFVARGERKLTAGRLDAAIKDFSAALDKDEQNGRAMYLRGKAFTENGDPRTGLEDLTAAIKQEGNRYEFRVARGVALRALGKADEAMDDFSAAIRSDPSQWEGYNQRGLTQYNAGKHADAEADFGRAIEKDEKRAVLWANRGEARFSQKKYADAAKDFAAAADLDPADPGHVMGLGNTLLRMGQAVKAAEVFVEAAQKWGNPVFLNRAGIALLAGGEHKAAVKVFTEAIKAFGDRGKASDLAMAYQGRGVAQRELKNYKEAIDDCTRAIDLNAGKSGYDYLERGLAHQANGQANAAADDFKAAEKLGVKVPEVATVEPVVGVWKMTTFANGMKITQAIELKKDGTFEAATQYTSDFGSNTVTDTGTWKMEKGKLTIRGKETGTVVRKPTVDGDDMSMEIEEIGKTVTYSRVK
jgi:tetratricopeptide (TPR) repeat protein